MLKKLLSLFIIVFISVFVLSVCYVIGVLRNWTDYTIGLYWFCALFITFSMKLVVEYIRHCFTTGKYRKLMELFNREKRVLILNTYFKNGFKIISKKGKGRVPWFILIGSSDNSTSLLNDIKLPVFQNNEENNRVQKLRTILWWFFRDLSVLEISNKIYDDTGLFNSIRNCLSSKICKKQPPQALVLVIPIEKLLNNDYAYIQKLAQKTRSFIEQLSSHLHHNIPVFMVINGCENITGYSVLVKKNHQKNNNGHPIFFATNTLGENKSVYDSSNILSTLKSNIMSSICLALDNTLSDQEKNEILLFPDKVDNIKYLLDVFISTFCVDNVFFPKAAICGVCLSGEHVQSKDKHYGFSDTLISEILPQVYNPVFINVNKQKIKTSFNMFVAISILCCLGYSAYRSYKLYDLKPDSAYNNPAFLIKQILKYEDNVKSDFLYLPFKSVLENKYLIFRGAHYKNTNFEIIPISWRVAKYKKNFKEASPSTKRELILALSTSLIIWDKMAQNESLSELTKYPEIHESLKITKPKEKISSIASIAIERDEIQKNSGIINIDTFRNLLTELIKSDLSYSWLISEYDKIPSVNITDFWEDTNSTIHLSGIWTQQGQNKLHHWYEHIKKAYGRDMVPEELSMFIQNLDDSRQEHFRQFIIAVARERKDSHSGLMNPLQLTNILHNRSIEQKFFQFIDEELRNIPASSAQDWLTDFRILYRLFSLKADNRIMLKIKQFNLMLRMYFVSIFNNSQIYKTPDHVTTWRDWQYALHNAVYSVLHTASSVELIKNAMRSDPKNKLVILFDKFEKIRSIINGNNTDPVIDSIWDIYEQQIYRLLDHAITYTGCWVEKQWKNSVLSKLNTSEKNPGHTEMQEKIYKNIISFLHSSANGILVREPEGVRLLTFKERSISFSPTFISFLNSIVSPDDLLDVQLRDSTQAKDELINIQRQLDALNQRLQKVESQPYRITISSAPATISGNPRVKPIGTSLVLECKTSSSSMRSMNFADSSIFTWYPGSCNTVSIDIAFPNFSTIYKFSGESAWLDFINKFSDGENKLVTENFPPESRSLLESMGITGILVRYKLSDASNLSQAYIEWEQLKLEKDKLEKLQDNLRNKLLNIHSWENSGWISRLPSNISKCPSIQE